MNNDIIFQVLKKYGTLATYPNGWQKEVNSISWNGGMPKVDIRDWSPDHERMSRGITLSSNEALKLVSLLNEHLIEDRK